MADQESVYEGYRVITSTSTMDHGLSFVSTVFSVRAKRGENWELICQDTIQGTFKNERDAHQAASAAARKWIDENAR